ncbi:MAG: hypothetical protein AW07_02045 [Candidatus Accumulibacter sp. SK-11]|nr:MAG: hypothetical protein AW07_02045 [Candidatus Accumulibacter sp. SK-11]
MPLPIGTKRDRLRAAPRSVDNCSTRPSSTVASPSSRNQSRSRVTRMPSCRGPSETTRTLLPFGHSTAASSGRVGNFSTAASALSASSISHSQLCSLPSRKGRASRIASRCRLSPTRSRSVPTVSPPMTAINCLRPLPGVSRGPSLPRGVTTRRSERSASTGASSARRRESLATCRVACAASA